MYCHDCKLEINVHNDRWEARTIATRYERDKDGNMHEIADCTYHHIDCSSAFVLKFKQG